MVTPALVEKEIADGTRLIQSLDTHNVRHSAVLWAQKMDDPQWELIIATPLVDERGPRSAYTDVQGILKSFDPPLSITLQDITVVSPGEPLIKELKKIYKKIDSLVTPRRITITPVAGYSGLLLVYRVR